jgi:hypothetical protein
MRSKTTGERYYTEADVADLNARLMRHCACQCGEMGEIVAMCEEHKYLVSFARSNEREACAKIADDHAENIPCGKCEGTTESIKCADVIADAIRARTER